MKLLFLFAAEPPASIARGDFCEVTMEWMARVICHYCIFCVKLLHQWGQVGWEWRGFTENVFQQFQISSDIHVCWSDHARGQSAGNSHPSISAVKLLSVWWKSDHFKKRREGGQDLHCLTSSLHRLKFKLSSAWISFSSMSHSVSTFRQTRVHFPFQHARSKCELIHGPLQNAPFIPPFEWCRLETS